ncbi:beta-N-acetylhexosaminidase, partial [candidate division KSB1 bacterium]|nr:beta-N-acetylhexosaminidase [candidate division KSB1 bacterium]
MKRLLASLLVILQLFLLNDCKSETQVSSSKEMNIIPQPVSIEKAEGEFTLSKEVGLYIPNQNVPLQLIAESLKARIDAASDFKLALIRGDDREGGVKQIIFALDESMENLGDEGYQLIVQPDKVEIIAPKPAGVFYGVQSLLQLLPPEIENAQAERSQWKIPCVKIMDFPRFKWRGQLRDVVRHFHNLDQLKRNIDNLARLKMNKFHLHLTDDQGWRLEIKSLPKLTEIGAWRVDHNDKLWWERPFPKPGEKATYGGFYTQEEMKALIQYARERNVEIIPEIDLPGHARAFMAAYPEVSCDGAHYDVASGGDERNKDACPAKEVTYQYAEKIFAEVAALFPSKYIHIGGDEARMHGW